MACKTVFRAVFLTEPWPRPLPFNRRSSFLVPSITTHTKSSSIPSLNCGCRISRARDFQFERRTQHLNCSHNGQASSSSSSSSSEQDHDQGPPQEAVLKAISEVSKTEGRVGQTTNVVIGGTVTDDSTNEWLALDQKVNSYPTVRGFTAIGSGGDDFVHSMVVAVESVLQQPIPERHCKLILLPLSHSGCPFSTIVPSSASVRDLSHQSKEQILKNTDESTLVVDPFEGRIVENEQVVRDRGQVKHKLSARGKYVSVNIGPVRVISSEQVQAVYNAMRRDVRMKYFL